MNDNKRCIFLISARKNLLIKCLTYLDYNYNNKHNYPIIIFYHGSKYDNPTFRNKIKSINKKTEYRFHKLKTKLPSNVRKKDLFWNLENNKYAKNFKGRIEYLHANYFWNNFMNYEELKEFKYLMRIDDDSWFKNSINFDFFDELNNSNCLFGTGYTWKISQNSFETRTNLFKWIKYYIHKHNIEIKDKKLEKSLNGKEDNKLFHSMPWNCGNCNIYNRKMFETESWKIYNNEFNEIAGGYKYRWGDCEVIGLYSYIHLKNPLKNFDLRSKNLYEPQLPNAEIIVSKRLKTIEGIKNFIKFLIKKVNRFINKFRKLI